MNTRTRMVAPAALACAVALAGCSGLNGTDDRAAGGGNGKTHSRTIVAAQIVGSGKIDRITGPQNPGSQIGMGLCENLTGIDGNSKVFMRGAKSVTSKDKKTWTITLQKNRTWSDGTPITAQTWVDSFNFVALGKNAMPGNYAYTAIQGYDALNPTDPKARPKATELSGLKVVDDDTFTLTMAKPNNDVPFMLASLPFCPMPKSGFKDPVTYDRHPVTNGPYKLQKMDPNVEAVLVRDKNYQGWVPKGAADKVIFRVYKDMNTAYQDVAAGNIDVVRSLPPGFIAQGKKALGKEGLTAIKHNTLETYLTWPTYLDKKYPKKVRRAFSMITNRDAISKNLFLGSSQAARSLMPDSVSAWRENPCGQDCEFNPAKAKALIAESGFKGTIPLLYNSENTTDAATALAISNEAKKIKLDIEPKPVLGAALSEDINSYQLAGPTITLWGSSFPSASEWIASVMVDANYRLKYKNPAADREVAKAWAADTTAGADRHWQAAEDLILADQVLQPLYYQVMYIAHNPCVTPHDAGGDMQIYRTEITCPAK